MDEVETVRTSWGTYPLDKATGLPQAPENCFWRVRRGVESCLWVDLRLRRKGWFSKKIETTVAKKDKGVKGVIEACGFILRRVEGQKFQTSSEWKALLGDYPPKKVPDVEPKSS